MKFPRLNRLKNQSGTVRCDGLGGRRRPGQCSASPRARTRRAAGPCAARRPGVTLMEVILAIAILGGSLAVLGEMVRTGARASRSARLLSSAQLLADSLAAEITGGVTVPESTQGAIEQYGGTTWGYTVQVEQVEQQGMLGILVTVYDSLDQTGQPTTYTVIRWMIDPQVEDEMELAAAEAEAAMAGEASDMTGSSDTSGADASATGGGR